MVDFTETINEIGDGVDNDLERVYNEKMGHEISGVRRYALFVLKEGGKMTAKEHATTLALGCSELTPPEKVLAIAVLLNCHPQELQYITMSAPDYLLEAAKDVQVM